MRSSSNSSGFWQVSNSLTGCFSIKIKNTVKHVQTISLAIEYTKWRLPVNVPFNNWFHQLVLAESRVPHSIPWHTHTRTHTGDMVHQHFPHIFPTNWQFGDSTLFSDIPNSSQFCNVAPPVITWFINPGNNSYIISYKYNELNHSFWSYKPT